MNKLCTFMEDQRCSNAPFSPKLRGALIKSLTLKKMFLYILQLAGLLRLSERRSQYERGQLVSLIEHNFFYRLLSTTSL